MRCMLFTVIALMAFAGGFLPAASWGAEVRLVGSDLLGVEFSKALHEFGGRNDLQFKLAFDGSRPGRDALLAGKADLAFLTLPSAEMNFGDALQVLTVAYHRVVVLASAGCPLERIAFSQLEEIFGANARTTVPRSGSERKEADEWVNQLAVLAPETGHGIALEYFRHVVLRGGDLKPRVQRYREIATLQHRFREQGHVLALAADFPEELPAARMVAVAATPDAPAFLPTAENLHRGDYPLRLPVCVVFRRDDASRLSAVLGFLTSEAAMPHFKRAGVVPLPAAVHSRQLATHEKGDFGNRQK
ncbi:MAG TPA: hypothetical protein VHN79_12370 [Lacunisphaera sp.]|nr:hypothetical protein [Lacunisphaera sp.]